jgi:predicted RNase H-like nuclease
VPSTDNIATLAKKVGGYDPRLNSEDVIERQQAEIEALRTCLIAANSESNGEYDRLRLQLEAMKASHDGQLRNTLAFKKEAEQLRAERDHWFSLVPDYQAAKYPFKPTAN